MRFTITEPCVIEVTGSVTFTSIPIEALDAPLSLPPPEPVYEVRHRRSSTQRPRHTIVCRGCGITFRGRSNQMYHDSACKSAFYRRMAHPEAKPLAISAGASGVEVRTGA